MDNFDRDDVAKPIMLVGLILCIISAVVSLSGFVFLGWVIVKVLEYNGIAMW